MGSLEGMMIGNNRDYKAAARVVRNRLSRHDARMTQLMQSGMSREQASKQALRDIRPKTTAKQDFMVACSEYERLAGSVFSTPDGLAERMDRIKACAAECHRLGITV